MEKATNSLLLTLFLSLPIFQLANAQTELSVYEHDAIYVKFPSYLKNGKKHLYGFGGKNLKKEMEVSPNAVIEYKKVEKNRDLFLVSLIIGSGLTIWRLSTDSDDREKRNNIATANLVPTGFMLYFGIKTINKAKKAAKIRNRDIRK